MENERINKLKVELNQLEGIQSQKIEGEPPKVSKHSKLMYIMHITWVLFILAIGVREDISGIILLSILVLGYALIMSMKTHDTVVDMANAGIDTIEQIVGIAEQGRVNRIEKIKQELENV
jgi:hypothetical protein